MISLQEEQPNDLLVYDLASELMLGAALPGLGGFLDRSQSKKRGDHWEPLFSSKAFMK